MTETELDQLTRRCNAALASGQYYTKAMKAVAVLTEQHEPIPVELYDEQRSAFAAAQALLKRIKT